MVRTSRGLSLAGTRITLYAILDYLHADWPPKLIQDWLDLTEQQMADVLVYLAEHGDEVEPEYRLVLQQAEEHRQYWEARNRDRVVSGSATPVSPDLEALRAKLQAWKAEIGQP